MSHISEEQKGVSVAGRECARARKSSRWSRIGAKCSAVVLERRAAQHRIFSSPVWEELYQARRQKLQVRVLRQLVMTSSRPVSSTMTKTGRYRTIKRSRRPFALH